MVLAPYLHGDRWSGGVVVGDCECVWVCGWVCGVWVRVWVWVVGWGVRGGGWGMKALWKCAFALRGGAGGRQLGWAACRAALWLPALTRTPLPRCVRHLSAPPAPHTTHPPTHPPTRPRRPQVFFLWPPLHHSGPAAQGGGQVRFRSCPLSWCLWYLNQCLNQGGGGEQVLRRRARSLQGAPCDRVSQHAAPCAVCRLRRLALFLSNGDQVVDFSCGENYFVPHLKKRCLRCSAAGTAVQRCSGTAHSRARSSMCNGASGGKEGLVPGGRPPRRRLRRPPSRQLRWPTAPPPPPFPPCSMGVAISGRAYDIILSKVWAPWVGATWRGVWLRHTPAAVGAPAPFWPVHECACRCSTACAPPTSLDAGPG
jgi:hypothetical protein